MTFFFLIQNHYFQSQNGRKQLSSRKGWKEDSGPLELGHEPARSRDSIQPLKGLGEEVATLGCQQDRVQRQPREASRVWILGFKFPGPIYWAFPQEVYWDLKIALAWIQIYTSTCYFQIWANSQTLIESPLFHLLMSF